MSTDEGLKEILFPYDKVRNIQNDLIKEVKRCIKSKKNLIVHAPTGLGKSAATLPVALSYAIKHGLTVFFLTSRHTQHLIALETLKEIKEKYDTDIVAVDLIGKKWMCPVPATDELSSFEFAEYCKSMREDGKCEFYVNSRKKSGRPTVKAEKGVSELKRLSPCHCEELIKYCNREKLCPYEISSLMAKQASVVIADYYYIFNPTIRDIFFKKTEKSIEDAIIIIDEGHNLPKRARALLTQNLSSFSISNALKEARKFGYEETADYLLKLKEVFENYKDEFVKAGQQKLGQKKFFGIDNERLIKKNEFLEKLKEVGEYGDIIANFELAAEEIREEQKRSYIGSIANFLVKWGGPDESFARILSSKEYKGRKNVILSYKCLDPSLITKEVFEKSYCSIIMSGTLTPTNMYKDILGFSDDVVEKEYGSPFPEDNKLSMIIPETTTKYTARGPEMYQKIAQSIGKIVNNVPGNSAVFFPSYRLRDSVDRYFTGICRKTTFLEMPGMSKMEKQELLEKFKSYKKTGAVLLGVSAANYAEGIDLPGDLLKAVVVVGLPLQRPDMETKELIDYYDGKYGRGWDYGYTFPAITKCLQGAGRCIRSEKDRGVIAFLDERFAWGRYRKCFPPNLNIKITRMYEDRVKEFFG